MAGPKDELTSVLFREYNKAGIRKLYRGNRKDIIDSEGFAWYSNNLNKWCFIPIKRPFTTSNIILVDESNLYNL
jgi:hypothetical protein